MTDQAPASVEAILKRYAQTTTLKNIGAIDEALDEVSRLGNSGSKLTPIGDFFYGFNHRKTALPIPINREGQGYLFVTKPDLNLSTSNLRSTRDFSDLLTTDDKSIQRIIRTTLSPRLRKENIRSPFTDPFQAFIPWISNGCLSVSGWPDPQAPTYSSTEGINKEVFGHVDGILNIYGQYDLSLNFRSVPGDPYTLLFYYWMLYSTFVLRFKMTAYTDNIILRRLDYTTRLYRLVMDPTNSRVDRIFATGYGYPISTPMGAAANFSVDKPFSNQNDQVSIPLRCYGFIANDPILIREFNRHTELFNSDFRDGRREQVYTRVLPEYLSLFNMRGYPRINPANRNLEWWVFTKDFEEQKPLIDKYQAIKGKTP